MGELSTTEVPLGAESGPDVPQDISEGASPDAEARPEGLPEKFKDVDSLIKAYGALENKLSQKIEEPGPENTEDSQAPEETSPAKDAVLSSDTITEYVKEYGENGHLSEDSYAKLAAAGLPPSIVDDYIGTKVQQQNEFLNEVYSKAGGTEQDLVDLTQWAAEALTPSDHAAYNDAIASEDPDRVLREISILREKAEAAGVYGTENNLYGISSTASSAHVGYKSMEEFHRDIADPKYASSKDFRDEVDSKWLRTNW